MGQFLTSVKEVTMVTLPILAVLDIKYHDEFVFKLWKISRVKSI